MKKTLFCMGALMVSVAAMAEAPLQTATYGDVNRHYIYSPELSETLTVDVLTPDGYARQESEHYPVVYMFDGQNCFDASTTWNHQSWEIDSVMGSLVDKGIISPAIVVGIHSVDKTRLGDLMPKKPIDYLEPEYRDSLFAAFPRMNLRSDEYAAFMANTLKHSVDSAYRTLPDAANTSVMGSSMGGIMSMYVICEYPEVFGNAACLSSHWVGHETEAGKCSDAVLAYIADHTPAPATHRIYLDEGTEHSDAFNGEANDSIIDLLTEKGYSFPQNLMYVNERKGGHQEYYWAKRLSIPLLFILHP